MISRSIPKPAAVWQDVLCTLATAAVALLTIKGGGIPILTYIEEKCQPNPILEE
jgi:hypothetical protein